MRPSSMLYRNLMAMELEEQLRANPIDSVVLLGGCDKTIPGLLMGAASVNLPTMVVSSGPKLNGKYKGEDIGSGVDIWKFVDAVRTGKMTQEEFVEAERCMARSEGHCMTMASASTMAVIAETIGLQLSGAAAIPGSDSRRYLTAHLTGRQAVDIRKEVATGILFCHQSICRRWVILTFSEAKVIVLLPPASSQVGEEPSCQNKCALWAHGKHRNCISVVN